MIKLGGIENQWACLKNNHRGEAKEAGHKKGKREGRNDFLSRPESCHA